MFNLRDRSRKQVLVAGAVLASVAIATAGIANAALSVQNSKAVDVSSVASAYNSGDKAALDEAFTKLKADLNASLDANVTPTTTPTTMAQSSDLTKLKIGIIGDSLTDMGGAGPDLLTADFVSRGWNQADVKVDGLGGRGIDAPTGACPEDRPSPYTSAVIDKWRASGFDPQVWLIALGTNNTGSTIDCQKALISGVVDKINSGSQKDYKIFWLGLGFRATDQLNGTADDFNARVGALAEQKDFTACDYNAWLTQNVRNNDAYTTWWQDDGVHSPSADAYSKVRVPAYGQCVLGQF